MGGRFCCPNCETGLRPWGHGAQREWRLADRSEQHRPRRSSCRACATTHVLVPEDTLLRRRDGVEVISPTDRLPDHPASRRYSEAEKQQVVRLACQLRREREAPPGDPGPRCPSARLRRRVGAVVGPPSRHRRECYPGDEPGRLRRTRRRPTGAQNLSKAPQRTGHDLGRGQADPLVRLAAIADVRRGRVAVTTRRDAGADRGFPPGQ